MKKAQKNDSLVRLYESGIKFLVPLSVVDTYKTIMKEAIKLVNASYGSIFIKKNGVLIRVYASTSSLYKTKIRPKGFTYRAASLAKPTILDISKVEKFHPRVKDMGVKSTIFIPLAYKKESIGVLSVDSFKYRTFSKHELDLLKHFGSLASLAIRKAQLYQEARDAIGFRDLFISLANHELRTPMTTIYAYSQLLEKKLAKKSPKEAKYAKLMKDESKRLELLLNDFLRLDQIRKGEMEYRFKKIDIRDVLSRATDLFESGHKDHRLIYRNEMVNGQSTITADFDKILQLVVNLLNNAAKFSGRGTEVELLAKRSGEFVCIMVKDHGVGIHKRDLGHIFEEFYKGNRKRLPGMGLGLFLARSIVDKHGGKISVKSKLNKGTIMEVLLPVN
ncbi:MAG: GAF domain-containing sensor histidine kinase [Candidatus Curtissbacteria bacterium]|nr:GAF domain-containing sensor histidine kinase [Candidatus Curtissbacteria bacterium]